MNILTEYTLNYIKKNRKNTISIIISITIATILLSTVVLGVYMDWRYNIDKTINKSGDYHGFFNSYINKSQIPYLKENQKIDKVYFKSEYYNGKSDLERQYINISLMDKDYWENMGEKNFILEGRIPEKPDEIVVIGSLLKENPLYKVGSKININIGHREINGEKIEAFDFIKEGEVFIEKEEKEYTIVGVISGKSLSYEPYYKALGFFTEELMDENTKLMPFLRMKNPRKVYKDLPQIGKNLGFEIGDSIEEKNIYNSRYNLYYLMLHGIFPSETTLRDLMSFHIFTEFIFVLLVMILFIIIIYNVFTIWSNSKLKQLGILKTVGATPKQIKKIIRREALFISIIPIILGITLGHLFCYMVLDKIKNIIEKFSLENNASFFNIQFSTSPIIILIIIILSMITIFLSISKPAKRLSKIVPIEAIKYGGMDYRKIRKKRKTRKDYDTENVIPSLAKDFLRSNRKSFTTTIISISMGFIIMFVFLLLMASVDADEKLNSYEDYFSMSLAVYSDELVDEALFKEVEKIPEIKESLTEKNANVYFKFKPNDASKEFKEIGGFESIDSYYIDSLEDGYEMMGWVYGLNHEKFNEYATSIGEDPNEYYNKENPKAILLNLVKEDINQPLARVNYIPYLKDEIDNLSYREYGGYKSNIEIGAKTSKLPWKDFLVNNYRVVLIVPRDTLNSMMENFSLPGDYSYSEYMRMLVDLEDIDYVREEIKNIAKYYVPESDYYIWDKITYEEESQMSKSILYIIIFSIVVFLAIIGISNAYSSINNNLRNRRREFAMLKSVGMTKDKLKELLRLEGIYYGLYPFLYSIPLSIVILFIIIKLNKEYILKDYLMFLDFRIITFYIISIFVSIYIAYYFGIRKVDKDEIVDTLRDDSI